MIENEGEGRSPEQGRDDADRQNLLGNDDPRDDIGGYLKIAPEHTEEGPLNQMMKPDIGSYDKFKRMFEKYTKPSERAPSTPT